MSTSNDDKSMTNQEVGNHYQPPTDDDSTKDGPSSSSLSDNKNRHCHDFVIRDGFPALYHPNGKDPWIHGPEPIPQQMVWAGRNVFSFHKDDMTTTTNNSYDYLERLRQDCECVFTARAKTNTDAYSTGVTYFLPALLPPRCALEQIVQSIFQQHTQPLVVTTTTTNNGSRMMMIPEQSGAEWWTLVLDNQTETNTTPSSQTKNDTTTTNHDTFTTTTTNHDNEEEEEEGDEVGLHFDADYGLEDQAPNLLLHPRLATVTYLSNYGAPTVILERKSPPPNDPSKQSLQGPISKGWLSHPQVGKHLAFDGRLLHGAPATFFPSKPNSQPQQQDDGDKKPSSKEPQAKRAKREEQVVVDNETRRITLLVNIWVNHCPLDAEPLEDDICQQLTPPIKTTNDTKNKSNDQNGETNETTKNVSLPFLSSKGMPLDQSPKCHKVVLSPCPSDPAGEEEFVLCGRLVTAKYEASMEALHQASIGAPANDDLVELDFQDGALVLEVGDMVEEEDDDDDNDDE